MNYFAFRLNETDTNLVMAGLGKLPAELSHNLINALVAELGRQKAAADAAEQAEATMGLEGNHAIGHQQALNSGSAATAHPQ